MLLPKIAANRYHSPPATESLSKSILATILSVCLCRASNQGWQTVAVQDQLITAIHQHLTSWPK